MAISAVDRIAQLEAELERCKEGYIAAVMKAAYLEAELKRSEAQSDILIDFMNGYYDIIVDNVLRSTTPNLAPGASTRTLKTNPSIINFLHGQGLHTSPLYWVLYLEVDRQRRAASRAVGGSSLCDCWLCPKCDKFNDDETAEVVCRKCSKGRFDALYARYKFDPMKRVFVRAKEAAQKGAGEDRGAKEEVGERGEGNGKDAAGDGSAAGGGDVPGGGGVARGDAAGGGTAGGGDTEGVRNATGGNAAGEDAVGGDAVGRGAEGGETSDDAGEDVAAEDTDAVETGLKKTIAGLSIL